MGMEILNAVAESRDKRLQEKFKHSLNVVDRTLALYRQVLSTLALLVLLRIHDCMRTCPDLSNRRNTGFCKQGQLQGF